jgi:hypothetical protein
MQERPPETVATFSIVAYDPANGDMGVAVQSRYFAVGSVVPWAEADVGVVATQAAVNTGYGPKGLALLREGLSPEQVIARLLAEDTYARLGARQVAVIDAQGRVAVHTGPEASTRFLSVHYVFGVKIFDFAGKFRREIFRVKFCNIIGTALAAHQCVPSCRNRISDRRNESESRNYDTTFHKFSGRWSVVSGQILTFSRENLSDH